MRGLKYYSFGIIRKSFTLFQVIHGGAITERHRIATICRNETANVDDAVFDAIVNNDYKSIDPSVPKNMVSFKTKKSLRWVNNLFV